jgi:butyryl-CoA dehydrogenase
MDFELSMKHRIIQKTARQFAERECGPLASRIDREAELPLTLLERMKPLGYFGLQIPQELDGAGLDTLGFALVVEAVSQVCAALGLLVAVHNSVVANPLLRFGTTEQIEHHLKPLARGECIGAFCLTEPNAGSDAAAIQTMAVVDGEEFILNGNKIFVTNGGLAGIALVFARTDLTDHPKESSVFIVETDRAGCRRGPLEDLVGMRGNPVGSLILDDCRLPRGNMLGRPGDGLRIAMTSLDGGRIGIAAQALGIAQAAMDAACRYAGERIQFGKPIGHFQAIQSKIADMVVQIEAARLLIYRGARVLDTGTGAATLSSAAAKLFAAQVAVRAALEAVQIHGGYGYTRTYPVERYLRDAKATEIYEGTSEIQRMVIGKTLLAARRRT